MHNVVVLVSGGKDSCYAIHQCVSFGHKVIAIGNLHPQEKDELDSFMFQSVGWNVISAYAECLDLPLYREILPANGSIHQSLTYEQTTNDEVEALFKLLETVKNNHPEITAVASGAILSNYQRNRVENVCERLGLVSLSYLWRKEQHELFKDMCDAPVDAILIKIASMGLKISHLGKTIQQMKPIVTKLNQMYGFHVCGEGGEYETLTLDSPLFLKRIVLDKVDTVVESSDEFSPVAYLRIEEFHLEDKPEVSPERIEMDRLRSIPTGSSKPAIRCESGVSSEDISEAKQGIQCSHKRTGKFLAASCSLALGNAKFQTTAVLTHLTEMFQQVYSVDFRSNSVFVHLYVKDMEKFSEINGIYVSFFDRTQPPARECVAVNLDLADGVEILVDVLCVEDCSVKDILHVQSISEWAPACIGPYSQACSTEGVIHLAGMIGLNPATMTLVDRQNELQRCLDSLESVLQVVKSSPALVRSCTVYYIKEVHSYGFNGIIEKLKAWVETNNRGVLVRFVSAVQLPRNSLLEVQLIAHDENELTANDYMEEVSDKFAVCRKDFEENGVAMRLECFIAPKTLPCMIQAHFGWEESTASLNCNVVWKYIEEMLLKERFGWNDVTSIRIFHSQDSIHSHIATPTEIQEIPITVIKAHQITCTNLKNCFGSIEVYCYK